MKRKIIAATMATAMLLSMAAPTAYAEDIVVGATAVETPDAAAPAPEVTEGTDTYDAADVPDGVEITPENFPDGDFRDYVQKCFDKDENGYLSADEISEAKKVEFYFDVSTLKGIEYLTALDTLSCNYITLTSLDLSKNTALTKLYCHDSQITDLDLSKNTALTELYCYGSKMTNLDLSKNTALVKVDCYDGQLTNLNVSGCTALTELQCYNNKLTNLDVSGCTALTKLNCSTNELTSLDVSKNTALIFLACRENQLTSIDVSKNTALIELRCNDNQLPGLDVSGCTALAYLFCGSNKMTSLDVSKNAALSSLYCESNELTSLDVSQNTALCHLTCNNNQLTSLDVSKNAKLSWLECYRNYLPILKLENNKELPNNHTSYSPQFIEQDGVIDIDSLVGQANMDRVSEIKQTGNGLSYKYDVIGNNEALYEFSKMVVYVNGSVTATPTPVPQTTANPDQPQSTATPTPTTPTTTPEPSTNPEPDATPEPTTPANPDDNNGTGDNNDSNTETPATPDTTGVEGFVDRLYSVCLGRPADAAGKADWVGQLTSYQISGTKAAYGFIFSQEFTNKNYSNADYVEHLYEAFMGRASDEGGKADWVGKLDAGTSREEVFGGFANSVEFDNICKSYGIVSKDIETFVTRLYSVCLDRQPDDAGLADWANQLRSQTISGKAAASGFVFSEEFTNKNYSNADYVEHLYAAFMGRASDEAGKADWVGKLDAGTSREEVFNGFADSAEFDNICSSYGIVRG